MSANDNPLDYLHVRNNPLDKAITDLERRIEQEPAGPGRELLRAIARVMRLLDQADWQREDEP